MSARMHNARCQESGAEPFARAALKGLAARPKTLPPVWFYDAAGSALFEKITDLPEYYLTRAEIEILKAHAPDMVQDLPPGLVAIEFGSGSSRKTPLLLQALNAPFAYVPIDVSPEALKAAAARIRAQFPALQVRPIEGQFQADLALPAPLASRPKLGFFPGSTIGNFSPTEAQAFLARARGLLGPGASLILGADAPKEEARLIAAYDDSAGVTAAFNKNLLARMNAELGADFDLDSFRHEARWNGAASRVEMHLVSLRAQSVTLCGQKFAFAAGESIHTENSFKYRPEALEALAKAAGWRLRRFWSDPQGLFFVYRFEA